MRRSAYRPIATLAPMPDVQKLQVNVARAALAAAPKRKQKSPLSEPLLWIFLLIGTGGVTLFPDGWPRFVMTAIALCAAFTLGANWQKDQTPAGTDNGGNRHAGRM